MDGGTVFVLGNLMLDMVASVDEEGLLERFGLLPDSIQMAGNKHHDMLYQEISKRANVKFCPGGSALNTVRLFQRIVNRPKAVCLVGAVGNDDTGQALVKLVEDEGIGIVAQVIPNGSTAKCASLLTQGGNARTMVTDLGAATAFSHEEFVKSEGWTCFQNASYLYLTGYFLKVNVETVMEVTRCGSGRGIPILLNLNAVWVTTSFKKELMELLPHVDILFGNESEAISLAEQMELSSETLTEFTLRLANFKKFNTVRPRLVIITRGEKSIVCADAHGVQEFLVTPVSSDNLVDSTGAGDAFVAGFMANYVRKMSTDECIACGVWAATEVLKGYGFVLPTDIPLRFQSRI